jgi:DNA-binding IclR family transcriptional regulator
MEEHEIEQYLREGPLEAFTPKTIADPKILRKQLKMIRKEGFAFSSGERVLDGLCAISAPIWDHNDKANYSLTVSVPLHRLRVKGRDHLGKLVKKAASEISKKLGHRPPLQRQDDGTFGLQPLKRSRRALVQEQEAILGSRNYNSINGVV